VKKKRNRRNPLIAEANKHRGETHQTDRAEKTQENRFDALLALQGSGRDLWADEHADEYVNRLREGWE